MRGVRDNIVFIDHAMPEDIDFQIKDSKDMGSQTSKQNTFEVEMVLKIVRYLVQQGYSVDKLVVLTPYLGQLQRLRLILAQEMDPVLNDLDMNELKRAGVANLTPQKRPKNPLRLVTIGKI